MDPNDDVSSFEIIEKPQAQFVPTVPKKEESQAHVPLLPLEPDLSDLVAPDDPYDFYTLNDTSAYNGVPAEHEVVQQVSRPPPDKRVYETPEEQRARFRAYDAACSSSSGSASGEPPWRPWYQDKKVPVPEPPRKLKPFGQFEPGPVDQYDGVWQAWPDDVQGNVEDSRYGKNRLVWAAYVVTYIIRLLERNPYRNWYIGITGDVNFRYNVLHHRENYGTMFLLIRSADPKFNRSVESTVIRLKEGQLPQRDFQDLIMLLQPKYKNTKMLCGLRGRNESNNSGAVTGRPNHLYLCSDDSSGLLRRRPPKRKHEGYEGGREQKVRRRG